MAFSWNREFTNNVVQNNAVHIDLSHASGGRILFVSARTILLEGFARRLVLSVQAELAGFFSLLNDIMDVILLVVVYLDKSNYFVFRVNSRESGHENCVIQRTVVMMRFIAW